MFLNLRQLQSLFLVSLAGQLLLFVVMYFLMDQPYNDQLGGRAMLITLTIMFLGYMVSTLVSQARFKSAGMIRDRNAAWMHYVWTVFIRLATMEMVNIIAIIFMYVSNNRLMVIPLVLGLIIFLQYRPDREQFESIYLSRNLSEEEE